MPSLRNATPEPPRSKTPAKGVGAGLASSRALRGARRTIGANPVGLLEELIESYGTEAVVTVAPWMFDCSTDALRWVLLIDGEEVPEADVRVRCEPEGHSVILLTGGGEEIELTRWPEGAPDPLVVDTLGALQRRGSGD